MKKKRQIVPIALDEPYDGVPAFSQGHFRRVLPIDKGWKFRRADDPESKFLDTQAFPTEIHRDLLHHQIIPDPFLGKNENEIQWVGEETWVYRTTFSTPPFNGVNTALVFEGLDTYATVRLNGKVILKSNNMFTSYRVDVNAETFSEEDNVLGITFESAFLIGKKIVENSPEHHWGCWNGDPSRLAVRKAQYHYVRALD